MPTYKYYIICTYMYVWMCLCLCMFALLACGYKVSLFARCGSLERKSSTNVAPMPKVVTDNEKRKQKMLHIWNKYWEQGVVKEECKKFMFFSCTHIHTQVCTRIGY